MSLKRVLRSGVAAACIASVAAPAGIAAPAAHAAAKRGGLDVRVATAKDFSRIEISGGKVTARRDCQTVVRMLPGDPDVARLHTSPPKWIKSVDKTKSAAGVKLVLTLADDAEAKIGQADGATYINVFEKAAPDPADHCVVRRDRQWDQNQERAHADRDEWPLEDVGPDRGEVETLVERQVGEQVQAHVEEGQQADRPAIAQQADAGLLAYGGDREAGDQEPQGPKSQLVL